MDSLAAYSSDEEGRYKGTSNMKEVGRGQHSDRGYQLSSRKDDDTNYDHVTMDMSEESNNNNSDCESPKRESYSRSSRSSSDDNSHHNIFQNTEMKSKDNQLYFHKDDKKSIRSSSNYAIKSSTAELDDRYSPKEESNTKYKFPTYNDDVYFIKENAKKSLNDEFASTSNVSDEIEKNIDKDLQRYERETPDKREKEFERERRYDNNREKERMNAYKDRYDKKYSSGDDKRRRERSRSRDKNYGSHRRSPSGERRGHNHRYSESSRSSNSRDRRNFRRSHSKSPSGSSDYKPSYKVSQKLQAMNRMGLQIKTPDGSMATAKMLLQQSFVEQVEKVKNATGIELPKYYNPAAMNPIKYASQIQKRKLLWGNKTKDTPSTEERVPESSKKSVNKWQDTKFAQDTDGKVASKFMRLMGIKNPVPNSTVPANTGDVVKKQEEMFEAMQAQYEVARATTHTMRGVGLGFSSHGKTF